MRNTANQLLIKEPASTRATTSTNYRPELDGLRGLSIIPVVISHICIKTTLANYAVGNLGVEIFFVLSGFLITTLLLKEKQLKGHVSLKKFYIRRALRILPVAYLFLVVLVLLNIIFKLNLSGYSLGAAALFIKNFDLPFKGDWINGHYWTLSIEEQFYLIFPVLIVYNLRAYIAVICLIVIGVPIVHVLYFQYGSTFFTNPVIHVAGYLFLNLFQNGTVSIFFGSVLGILTFKNIIPKARFSFNRFAGLFILIIGVIFKTTCRYVINSNYINAIIFAFLITIVLHIITTQKNDLLAQLLKAKWLVKLGVLSYSIYIWQQIFTIDQPWSNTFPYAGSLLINLPAMLIVSYLSYYFYELNFLKLKSQYK
jgi:peptidoglycan/LPS O-acetylase OafA/YrhL